MLKSSRGFDKKAWFPTGVVRSTNIKQGIMYEWHKNGTKWHSMAAIREVFGAISHGLEAIQNGAFST